MNTMRRIDQCFELAVVTREPPDSVYGRTLANVLLEKGLFFQGIAEQHFLCELPAGFQRYRAVLLDRRIFNSLRRAGGAPLAAVARYAARGFVGLLPEAVALTAKINAKLFYGAAIENTVSSLVAHAGLTVNHPAGRQVRAARTEDAIVRGMKQGLMQYLAAAGRWNEFRLHNWQAALALLNSGGHADIRAPLLAHMRKCFRNVPPAAHHDYLGGYFAAAWLYRETGARAPLKKIIARFDELLARRPRTPEGLLGGCGFRDDPLCLKSMRAGAWCEAATLVRREVVWNEAFHFLGPTAGALYQVTGNPKYLREVVPWLRHLLLVHQDRDGLLRHASRRGIAIGGKWGRGMAHALLGAMYLAAALPPGHAAGRLAVQLIRRGCRGLLKFQDRDSGLWRNLIDQPLAFLESSCSASFAYIMARGVNEKWLERELFLVPARRAVEGLKQFYWRGGVVANCVGTGVGDTGYYLARPRNWTTAFQYLNAICELKKSAGAKAEGGSHDA